MSWRTKMVSAPSLAGNQVSEFAVMLRVEDMRSLTTPGSNGHMTGMGSLDEEISAMLQSNHTTFSQASLAEVIAQDIFSSPCPPLPGGGGLARTASVGLPNRARPRSHSNSRNDNIRPQNQQPWAHVTGDAKWMLDSNGEVLDVHTGFDSFGFGMMNAPAAAPSSGGLHRHHSAPSAFLQALADEAFSQIPPPPPSANMGPLFSEGGLTPIIEVMDVERMGSGDSVNELEQFLSPDSDFSRRAAMSALQVKSDNAETFSSLFPATKSTGLVRQKSLPVAQQTKPKQIDAMEEHQHSEESISGTSEDNSMVSGFIDTITSWPSSPTTSSGGGDGGGKRPRNTAVPAWDQSETTSSGLIRHLSLPTDQDPEMLNMVQMRARAKRGCATHPRSIAERVRRTRISDRMKKLQDLVPNMEKTTNTSDMLDETVEYVKSLQLQVSELQQTIAQLKAQKSNP